MAEKDTTQRTLESLNDVFADIVNGLLFNGEEVVNENDLINDTTHSVYKVDGKLHDQERDVSKFWKNCQFRIALFGIENQTAIDNTMPLRIMGYDGASYRQQLLDKKQKHHYPVVTIVLYFGDKKWDKNLTLHECLDIPEKLLPYTSNYKINVFNIAHLTPEQVNLFKSDFRLVTDFFVKRRLTGTFESMTGKIKHTWEVLNLLKATTGDNRFEKVYYELEDKEDMDMCDVVDKLVNKGAKETQIKMIINLHKMDCSNEMIAKAAEITEQEVKRILKEHNM